MLKGAAAAALAMPFFSQNSFAEEKSMELIKPKALKTGSTIGIIAPGTAVSDPDDIAKAVEIAEYFGFNFKFGKNLEKGSGYKSRSDKERLYDLHEMFSDKEVEAVICIRGGYGSARLLDKIDYDLIRNNAKIFLGYSDITAMHLAINRHAGLVTFHGPVMLSKFSPYTINYFKKALFESAPLGQIENPGSQYGARESYPLRTVSSGKASGSLIGGNLTLISTTMGTPYEIKCKDKILFLEDVGEEPYSIDRMLTQLRLAGKFDEAAGIIFGVCSGCDYNGLNTSRVWDSSFGETLDDLLGDLPIPVLYGYTFGHVSNQITIPVGVRAELDADSQVFSIIESGLSVE